MDDHLVIKFVDKENLVSGETYAFLHEHYGIMQGIFWCQYSEIKHYYDHLELSYFTQNCGDGDRVRLHDVEWVGTIGDSIG